MAAHYYMIGNGYINIGASIECGCVRYETMAVMTAAWVQAGKSGGMVE